MPLIDLQPTPTPSPQDMDAGANQQLQPYAGVINYKKALADGHDPDEIEQEGQRRLSVAKNAQGVMNVTKAYQDGHPWGEIENEFNRRVASRPQPSAMDDLKAFGGRALTGAKSAVPGLQSGLETLRGGHPYSGSNGGYRALGDISQGILTGATLGRGLGAGAALGAGLEASGVNDATREAQKYYESKENAQTPSVAGNFMRNLPAALGDVAAGILPALVAGKVADVATPAGIKSLSPGGFGTEGEGPQGPSTPNLAEQGKAALAEYGGSVPTSAGIGNKILSKSAGVMERGAKLSPYTSGKFDEADMQNHNALNNYFSDKFGPDITSGPTGTATGNNVAGILENMVQRRSAKIDPVMDQLKAAGNMDGLGSYVSDKMAETIQNSKMLPDVKAKWQGVIGKISKLDDPEDIMNELTQARINLEKEYPGVGNKVNDAEDRSFNIGMGAAKDSLYDGLNKIKTGLGDSMREAKADYAEDSKNISPLSRVLASRKSPEYVMDGIMKLGSKQITQIMEGMTPEEQNTFQQEAARHIIEKSKNANGNIDPKPMSFNLNKRFKDQIPSIFGTGQGPKILNDLQVGHQAMKAANINEIETVNPSGSGRLGLEQHENNPLSASGIAKGASALGYTFGIKPAITLAQKLGVNGVGGPGIRPRYQNLGKIGRLIGQQEQGDENGQK